MISSLILKKLTKLFFTNLAILFLIELYTYNVIELEKN